MPNPTAREEHQGAMNGDGDVDVRLSELELRSEFQARTMEDLDAVVHEFAARVARLEQELKELRAQLEAMTAGDGDLAGAESDLGS